MKQHSRRSKRVAGLIREELGQLLEHEVKDPRIGFATITAVTISPDLRTACVWVSILGDEKQKQQAMEGLAAAQGFLRYQLGKRLRLRYVPAVAFELDPAQEAEQRVDELLRRGRSDS